MDFRAFDFLMDPVFVINASGVVRYANPAALKWLTAHHHDAVLNKPLSDLVTFSGANIQQLSGQLVAMQGIPAAHAEFELVTRKYQGFAKIAYQRLQTADGGFALGVFIRDRAFAELSYEEGLDQGWASTGTVGGVAAAPTPPPPPPKAPAPPSAIAPSLDMSALNATAAKDVLAFDETTMSANLNTLAMVNHETKMVLQSPKLGRPFVTRTLRFAPMTVDCPVEPGKFQKGDKVSIDVFQSASVPQYQATGTIIEVIPAGKFEEIRIQYDQLSARLKQTLADFVKNGQ